MTAPDEISDWAISAALQLIEARLASLPFTGLLVAGTRTEGDSYQVLVCLAREIGRMLRPDGHPSAEPIGASEAVLAPATAPLLALGATHAAVVRDVATAARLVGSAAASDAPMTRALALAVSGAADAPTSARSVLRAMLEILAHEPIRRSEPMTRSYDVDLESPDHSAGDRVTVEVASKEDAGPAALAKHEAAHGSAGWVVSRVALAKPSKTGTASVPDAIADE